MSPGIWEGTTSCGNPIIVSDGISIINTDVVAALAKRKGAYKKDANGRYIYDSNGNKVVDVDRVGYGLTQWTPYTKYIQWCNNGSKPEPPKHKNDPGINGNGTGGILPFWDIDSQLMRIEAEVQASKGSWIEGLSQWIPKPEFGYDLTFADFIISQKESSWLAAAFAFCYERPARTKTDPDGLRRDRAAYGEYWYNYLRSLSPMTSSVDTLSKLSLLKIDSCEPTKATFSCIAKNYKAYNYCLNEGELQEIPREDEEEASIFLIRTIKNLTPNTNYSLKLTITGEDDQQETKEIQFTTPQDYPSFVKSIKFSCLDEIKSVNSNFSLSVNKPEHVGYWEKSGCYEIQLIVNNSVVKVLTESMQDIIWEKFTIKQKFDYSCKTGDSIQVGIIAKVEDNKGTVLYNNNMQVAKTSKSICLLNKPIKAYLNIN
jgi:hypothetical protein